MWAIKHLFPSAIILSYLSNIASFLIAGIASPISYTAHSVSRTHTGAAVILPERSGHPKDIIVCVISLVWIDPILPCRLKITRSHEGWET